MPAATITPVALLAGFAIVATFVALLWSAMAVRSRRRLNGGRLKSHGLKREDDPIIDLAYLERAIKADEDATARRAAASRPLLSQSPSAQPNRAHRLPTRDQDRR